MTTETLTLENLNITETLRYVERGYPWEEWDLLRREAPVYWYDREDVDPFWAITRQDEILTISKNSDVFVNTERLRIFPKEQNIYSRKFREELAKQFGSEEEARQVFTLSFIDMDDPQHATYRNLTNRHFTPRALQRMEGHIAELSEKYVGEFAKILVDRVAEQGSCDFVHDLAVKLPMAAIFELLGIPREDWDELFVHKEIEFGSFLESDLGDTPEERDARRRAASTASREYIDHLLERRREEGATGDDLVSVLVRSEVDGRSLTGQELHSYINLLLAGGLETTRNATTGGVLTLLEHPEELDKLVADPSLVPSAVEEILRWTSPVIQFARTSVADFELRGHTIRAGESVAMWYPSANRDEAVFEDPYRFDIARTPNDHLAFGGYGAHFCVGANLARWELRGLFRELIRLLPEMELAAPPVRQQNLHVGGYVRMMVRYRETAPTG